MARREDGGAAVPGHQAQPLPLQQLITGRYRLDQVTDALKAMAEFREVKPVMSVRQGGGVAQ